MPSKEEEVDDELRRYLRAVDEYQTASAEVAAFCKSGLFDIAQARKAMAGKGIGVSQIHYPARMRARATVDVGCSDGGEEGDAIMRLHMRDGPLPPGNARGAEDEEDDPGADRDPIKWFGLLIPQHLRNSQATFKKGVASAVGAARAVVAMDQHYNRYLELKRSL